MLQWKFNVKILPFALSQTHSKTYEGTGKVPDTYDQKITNHSKILMNFLIPNWV